MILWINAQIITAKINFKEPKVSSLFFSLKKYPAANPANVFASAFVPRTSKETISNNNPQPKPANIPINCPSRIAIQTTKMMSKSGVMPPTETKFRNTTWTTDNNNAIIP